MTAIAKRKTIIRAETSTTIQHRPLIVTLGPYSLTIREKGRRKGYAVDWESIFVLGATKEADRQRAERKAKRGKR